MFPRKRPGSPRRLSGGGQKSLKSRLKSLLKRLQSALPLKNHLFRLQKSPPKFRRNRQKPFQLRSRKISLSLRKQSLFRQSRRDRLPTGRLFSEESSSRLRSRRGLPRDLQNVLRSVRQTDPRSVVRSSLQVAVLPLAVLAATAPVRAVLRARPGGLFREPVRLLQVARLIRAM